MDKILGDDKNAAPDVPSGVRGNGNSTPVCFATSIMVSAVRSQTLSLGRR